MCLKNQLIKIKRHHPVIGCDACTNFTHGLYETAFFTPRISYFSKLLIHFLALTVVPAAGQITDLYMYLKIYNYLYMNALVLKYNGCYSNRLQCQHLVKVSKFSITGSFRTKNFKLPVSQYTRGENCLITIVAKVIRGTCLTYVLSVTVNVKAL